MYNIINKKILAAGLAAVLLLGVSCNKIKDFGTTNNNPNGVSDPNLAALLTTTEINLSGWASAAGANNTTRGGLYSQFFSETQYTDVSLYNTPTLDFAGFYSGSLFDLQNIIDKNSNPATAAQYAVYGSNKNQIAVARILKAFIYWNITDLWGAIPYSEALKLSVPKYDTQESIYKDILQELTQAVAQFDAGDPIKGDIIYSGDNTKWKKLANSLRMLVSLRLSKVYPAAGDYAATQFAAAASNVNGYITTNAGNLTLAFPGGSFQNPWYNMFDGREDFAESKTMTDLMLGMGDTRVAAFGDNSNGFPYGLDRDLAATVPKPWPKILSASQRTTTSSVVIVGASTVLLAYAEAVERGWLASLVPAPTTADAQAAYTSAVTLSYARWGITMPGSYLTGNASYTSGAGVAAIGQNSFGSIPASSNAVTTTKLQRIQLQRYIALYPNGAQAFSEWRRTGVPDVKPTTFATNTTKQIPRRFTYGQSEYTLNAAGVAQGIATLTGGDTQDARVWWDK